MLKLAFEPFLLKAYQEETEKKALYVACKDLASKTKSLSTQKNRKRRKSKKMENVGNVGKKWN